VNEPMVKALSVRQPWAWAIVAGLKPVENRTWRTVYRGPLAIHASQRFDADGAAWIAQHVGCAVPAALPHGGIVGHVQLTDCVEQFDSPWFFGPYGFVLQRATALPLVPLPGRLRLFDVAATVLTPATVEAT